MMRRIWLAYKFELAKTARLKSTYLGPILVILATLGTLLVRDIARDNVSDYDAIAFVTPVALNLGLLLILVYSAGLVSSELGSGTIRTVLVRALLRREFLAGKLLLGLTYAGLISVLVCLTSWLLTALFGDLAGISYGGEIIYSTSEMWGAYVLGALASLAPMSAAAAYAIMVSTVSRNTGTAITAAIGLWFAVEALKYPMHVAPVVFTTYFETPWQVFIDRCNGLPATWGADLYYCLLTSGVSFLVFFAVAMLALSRRNLHA